MKRIRLCLVAPALYPLLNPDCRDSYGGTEVVLSLLAARFSQDPAYDVACVVADHGQPAEEMCKGVRVLRSFRFGKGSRRWKAPAQSLALWRALARADADIYLQSNASAETGLTALFCQARGRTLVYRVSSSIDVDGSFRRTFPLRGLFYEYGLGASDTCTVTSREQEIHLARRYGVPSVLVPSIAPLTPPGTSVQRDAILWAGRWDAVKRPGLFIRLAGLFPQETFVMITQDVRTPFDGPIPPNVRIHSDVRLPQVPAFFARARILVSTSLYEGFPNVFIMATQAALPILSLSVDPGGVIARHSLGLVGDGSLRSLAGHLSSLLEGRKWLEAGRCGPPYFESHHTPEASYQRLDRLFRTLSDRTPLALPLQIGPS